MNRKARIAVTLVAAGVLGAGAVVAPAIAGAGPFGPGTGTAAG
jgi:hypothetical protein